MTTTRYIATNWSSRLNARPRPFHIEDVAIGGHLTLFKTLRNAVASAGSRGAVWLFDLSRLPRIAFDRFVPGTAEYRALERARAHDEKYRTRRSYQSLESADDQIAEQLTPLPELNRVDLYRQFEEAEQQMIMWAERAQKLERMLAGRNPE